MFADERQKIIQQHIRKKGAVTTAALMEEFCVSIETVRRDLLCMEKHGILKRVHGGAVAMSELRPFNDLKERNKEFVKEKTELAENAVKFVMEGDIVFIDSGSTAICFAEVIKERFNNLTVITHSLDVFNILSCKQGFEVILCGGHFSKKENAFYGSIALETVNGIYAQKAFLCPSAVSIEFGICDFDKELVQIQKQIINSIDEIYILADSGKFERKALLKISDMEKDYHYITDSKLPCELALLYGENGIDILSSK